MLPFLSILRPRSTFYDTVADNLERALAERASLRRSGDEVVLVLAEDFEDVNGMARQVGLAADLVDASFLVLTGDLTFAGLAVETYIIDTVDYYSDHRPVYFAPGLHDTEVVVEAAAARGWHVADGKTVDAEGLNLLAAADPRITTVGGFGTGSVLRDPDVDVDQLVSDTVEEACAEQPDLVILHDHLLGRRIAEAGCQEVAVLDGRSYEFVGPQEVPVTSDGPHPGLRRLSSRVAAPAATSPRCPTRGRSRALPASRSSACRPTARTRRTPSSRFSPTPRSR